MIKQIVSESLAFPSPVQEGPLQNSNWYLSCRIQRPQQTGELTTSEGKLPSHLVFPHIMTSPPLSTPPPQQGPPRVPWTKSSFPSGPILERKWPPGDSGSPQWS